MAFVKRNWLARIGIGLNKFIIGNKDGEGKQTLTNSPDSVTQQGDVISADNLNDLEDRIETAVNANETAIDAMKLTKVWENPNPSADMSDGTVANLSEPAEEIIVEFKVNRNADHSYFNRMKMPSDATGKSAIMMQYMGIQGSDSIMEFYTRRGEWGVNNNQVTFRACSSAAYYDSAWHFGTTGYNLIPIAIYKVGDIYNS